MNQQAHVACNVNYLFENEWILKVTASHVHCKCGNISATEPGIYKSLLMQTAIHTYIHTYIHIFIHRIGRKYREKIKKKHTEKYLTKK